ncbi:hypothetical protein LINGRAHAP2_LOCUS30765, partial [Linum grandiflorum]
QQLFLHLSSSNSDGTVPLFVPNPDPDHLLPFFSRRVPSFLFPLIFRRHGFTKFEHHSHHIFGLNRFPAISTPYLNNRQQFLIKNLELQGVESKLTGASSVYIEPSISRRLV